MNELPAGTVDLVFADPPFNIGYDYDVYDDRQKRDEYLDWCRSWIAAVHRALKPSGTFWLAIGDEYAAELKLLSQEIGFHCRSWVIWYYTFGVNCTHKFSRSHAHLFYFVKDPKSFTFRAGRPGKPRPVGPAARLRRRPRQSPRPAAGRHVDPASAGLERLLHRRARTRGISRAWRARSRSGPASTAARCPSNFWPASSAPAPTKGSSSSTRLPAARRRWSSPRSSAAAASASRSAKTTPAAASPGSSKPASAIRSKERSNPLVSAPSTSNGKRRGASRKTVGQAVPAADAGLAGDSKRQAQPALRFEEPQGG